MSVQGRPVRLAVVGAGDVWHRHYQPPLVDLGAQVEVGVVVDPSRMARDRALAAARHAWPRAISVGGLDALDATSLLELDGALNLTPAPMHGRVTLELLGRGLSVYSEKPLALSIAQASRLIEVAHRQSLLLQCAPGTAVTARQRWLMGLLDDPRFGRPTLAVAHHADPGPAAWREYTGDPRPFYRVGVGPLFDHGVYRLHEMTLLMGPVRRVQAMGAISAPTRRVRGGPLAGKQIEVDTPDHLLLHLEFARGGLGQLLASFGTPETLAPWLEVHFPMATVSFGGKSWEPDAPVSIYLDDEGPGAAESWQLDVEVPRDSWGTVESGVRHFVACLRGEARPALGAEHARHVLDVMLKAYESIASGRSVLTETTF